MANVIVIGGGISGLSLAFRLGQKAQGVSVQVLESADRLGGKVWTERKNGFLVESGPNGFIDMKPSSLDLCRDLGIADQLISGSESARKNRFLFRGRGLERLPDSLLSFLRSPVLSWKGKLSLLAERLRPRRTNTGEESVAQFARRRLGREAADTLADAFVAGIHASDPELLSLPAAFPRLATLEREYGGIFKGMSAISKEKRRQARVSGQSQPPPQKLWSFAGGMRVWIEALAARLSPPPRLNSAIKSLSPPTDQTPFWTVATECGNQWTADAIALTCPAPAQARLLDPIDRLLAEKIAGISYSPLVVVALAYRATDIPLAVDGFGYLTPQRLGRDVLGVQWCSSIFPDRAGQGEILLRAMCGGASRPDIPTWDDDRLLQAIRTELRISMGVQAAPIFEQIIRWPQALPQYHLGHLDRVAEIEARASAQPGLFMGGNAYHGVSLNDCTEQAAILADKIVTFLGSRPLSR